MARLFQLIFSVVLFCSMFSILTANQKDSKTENTAKNYTPLFNGKDLTGWTIMNNGRFSVRENVIFINRGGGWLRSEKKYQDFEMRMEFRFIDAGSNSGIFFRANDNKGPNRAYQVQTKDGGFSIGSIYTRGLLKPTERKNQPVLEKVIKPAGEWQEYLIKVVGEKVEVRLNGELINSATGLTDEPGFVGIQGEGGTLEFKTVEIEELKSEKKE